MTHPDKTPAVRPSDAGPYTVVTVAYRDENGQERRVTREMYRRRLLFRDLTGIGHPLTEAEAVAIAAARLRGEDEPEVAS